MAEWATEWASEVFSLAEEANRLSERFAKLAEAAPPACNEESQAALRRVWRRFGGADYPQAGDSVKLAVDVAGSFRTAADRAEPSIRRLLATVAGELSQGEAVIPARTPGAIVIIRPADGSETSATACLAIDLLPAESWLRDRVKATDFYLGGGGEKLLILGPAVKTMGRVVAAESYSVSEAIARTERWRFQQSQQELRASEVEEQRRIFAENRNRQGVAGEVADLRARLNLLESEKAGSG